ncbi:hypothetical protein [Bradyrhizobium japonicum]|uniref:hypothetical protein n=1 Tax=Bradyrhizobium japonicum TaxID=375 RepID=UPI00048479D1|nr:hypothetical protein [Bradyrhizobium japonicum]
MKPITPTQWSFLKRYQSALDSKECLSKRFGGGDCNGRIVHAHMIPRSQLLQIAEQGHVHAAPTRLSPIAQMKRSGFQAEDIGIGNFSTLQCFCARHDKSLFAPLEDVALTFTREQLTLLHYRAMAAEVYIRGNAEDAAANEARKYVSTDPQRQPFYNAFQIHSLAAIAAEEHLKRTETMINLSRYDELRAAIIRFDATPVLLSVCAFRPLYDVIGTKLQNFSEEAAYIGMHILTVDKKPAVVFTWLKGQKPSQRFAKSFCLQPYRQLTTLAVQTAFEYAEHTCMRREWWMSVSQGWRTLLLNRIEMANGAASVPDEDFLSFEFPLDDWKCRSIDFVK